MNSTYNLREVANLAELFKSCKYLSPLNVVCVLKIITFRFTLNYNISFYNSLTFRFGGLNCQIRIFTSSNTHIHFIANAFSHHQIRIFVSSQTQFHIIKYAYSFHRKHISVRHFVDIYGYEGTINRSPTAANGLPTTLLANWNNMANTPQNIHIQPRNACDQFATT